MTIQLSAPSFVSLRAQHVSGSLLIPTLSAQHQRKKILKKPLN
jgi:hypothetical protein